MTGERTTGRTGTVTRDRAPAGPGEPDVRAVPWWRGPYAVLAGLMVLWAVGVTLRHQWAGDFRLHLATIEALQREPWHPRDPMVGAADGSPYYSPYMVFLALAGHGVAARTLLEISGVVNVVLLLAGVWRFVGRRAGAFPAVLTVVFWLLLWGTEPRDWSGFLDLYSLSWTLSYPSTLATALMLFTWDAALTWLDRPAGWRRPALIGVLGFLVVLVHPFTAVNTMIGLAAFAVCRPHRLRAALTTWRSARWLLLATVVAGLAVLLWPWSDITTLLGASGEFSDIHRPLIEDITRDWGLPGYGLAAVCVPALALAGRRALGRELQALFLTAVFVLVVGVLVLGNYGFGRVIPVVLLPLHAALAIRLGTASRKVAVRIGYGLAALLFCVVGVVANVGGLVRLGHVDAAVAKKWNVRDSHSPYDALVPLIRPGSVVITTRPWARRVVNARGAYSVQPGWPYPFVNEDERTRDAKAFFRERTTAQERQRIAERYHVACVLAWHTSPPLKPGGLAGFDRRTVSGKYVLACRSL
ncbi:hypothetical protein [Actinomadura rubteroloni]|uniref:hypothetical protein n=1 Tax=Actinomadura rubteroloni TaxID=1926885 RepID=UPI0011B017BA|nr:hypothetical protein [Actinomadura rubteroloni]